MAANQRYFFLDTTIGDRTRWACVSLRTSIIGPTVKATVQTARTSQAKQRWLAITLDRRISSPGIVG